MFDLGASELLLIMIVAVLVIGPKDMPLALRTAGRWIGKIRRLSGHFRTGLDAMVREAEMEEMEKKWKTQNEKIMREDPASLPTEMEPTGALPSRPALGSGAAESPAPVEDRSGVSAAAEGKLVIPVKRVGDGRQNDGASSAEAAAAAIDPSVPPATPLSRS